MTRTNALVKLLALGPLTREEIRKFTLWPDADVVNTIMAAIEQKVVTYKNTEGRRVFMRVEDCPRSRQIGKRKESHAFVLQKQQPYIFLQNIIAFDFHNNHE